MVSVTVALVCVLGFAGHRVYKRLSSPAPASAMSAGKKPYTSLRQMMQSGVHQEYTFISFTIWHDRPLTAAKLDLIADSSARIGNLARELDSFNGKDNPQGWSLPDAALFHEKSIELYHVSQELNQVAVEHDTPKVQTMFHRLDNTCQSCHKHFRPDLRWM
jgi:cytochrome c556